MKDKTYRLGEYKIIESDSSQLTWEAHSGFGEFHTGRCFKKGSILFIAPPENRQHGFLKGEFLDNLKNYPRWDKTIYFCNGFALHHCKSGKRVTNEEMMLWTLGRSLGGGIEVDRDASKALPGSVSARKLMGNAIYRLQRYEITIKADGQIISKTFSGTNTVNSVNCFILENILFIGPHQNKFPNLEKRQFIALLHQLPRWDQTDFFCKSFSLHECNPGGRLQGGFKKMQQRSSATKKHGSESMYKKSLAVKIPNGGHWKSHSKRISAILDSFSGFLKSLGQAGRFFNSKCIKSYCQKIISVLPETFTRIIKRIFRTIAVILSIITATFGFIYGRLKNHHEGWKRKKYQRSIDHHKDH